MRHLLMVSKIGLIDFIADDKATSYKAMVGQNREVTLTFADKETRQ
jgi:hypothetical protein